MVEHAAERVVGIVALGRHLDRLGDRDAERAGAVGMQREDPPAGLGLVRGRGDAARAVALHQRAPVGLLLEADLDHVDVDVQAEQAAGERQRRAPLAGAGLGRDPGDALLPVVVGLGHGGVRLVAAGGAHAFVLVVDPGGGIEQALEPARPVERRRAPQAVDVAHLVGDRDPRLPADLLRDQRHREQGCQVVRADRLQGSRMQRRGRGLGQVRREVVPFGRDPVLGEDRLQGAIVRHGLPPLPRSLLAGQLTGASPRRASAGEAPPTGFRRATL